MSALRVPLRERRNVQLFIYTDIPYDEDDQSPATWFHCYSTKSIDPRRRDVPHSKKQERYFFGPRQLTFDHISPALIPVNHLTTNKLISLHELLPKIYVSLHPGRHIPRSIVTSYGSTFTHIVRICHEIEDGKKPVVHMDRKCGLQILNVAVPKRPLIRSLVPKSEVRETVLTRTQLRVARDFLALALPYVPRTEETPKFDGGVRTLITAPAGPGAAADVMAVAICYLAFTSRYGVQGIAEIIRSERQTIPATWRYGVPTKISSLQDLEWAVQAE